ncbi:BAG family molecular chaperone regulator 4 [Selaginella moellendorffii]|uniref:BAG family molecular chaperone regulator 4 n=1 Tax=Selaginella moellendorffii TaxID=88036 RepID=UPI000D1CF459|nr:BAG family molecular chaperone regulator 4 [Selaginella moellendorffii]|eukprot:XP_002975739.2 BAG family molecular chaperone regulator 4 [Selaginella moellendorffii]
MVAATFSFCSLAAHLVRLSKGERHAIDRCPHQADADANNSKEGGARQRNRKDSLDLRQVSVLAILESHAAVALYAVFVDESESGDKDRCLRSVWCRPAQLLIDHGGVSGDLKKLLVQPTGLQAREQRILYRGKEKDSGDYLHLVGVKDKAKVVLIEDPESRERKQEESRHNERILRTSKAVSAIKSEVDKLAERVLTVENDVHRRVEVPESEFDSLTEALMMLLLKLDGIEAFGDAKAQRRIQVRRVQKFVEALDALKMKNSSPPSVAAKEQSPAKNSSSSSNAAAIVVTTQWETFETSAGNFISTPPKPATTAIETDWERALFT